MDIKGVKDISNVIELDAIIVGCLDRPTSGRFVLQGQDVSQTSDDGLVRVRRAAPGSARAQLRGHPARSDCRRRASPASSLARGILLSTLTSPRCRQWSLRIQACAIDFRYDAWCLLSQGIAIQRGHMPKLWGVQDFGAEENKGDIELIIAARKKLEGKGVRVPEGKSSERGKMASACLQLLLIIVPTPSCVSSSRRMA